MPKTYRYLITDFPYQKVDPSRLALEIQEEPDIYIALIYVNVEPTLCDIVFKAELSEPEEYTLASGILPNHSGEPLPDKEAPTMADGRPLVRADTRPLDTATYFTTAGDTASGIGDGTVLMWDFGPDSEFTTVSGPYDCSCGSHIPTGYKAQIIDLKFLDPIYLKDGTIYFFDAPWGTFATMSILVPAGGYYPNENGSIPSEALGLPAGDHYSYATHDVIFYRYVNRHFMYGSCPMGDELNAEGCMVDALPVGWFIRAGIVTPISDNKSKGFADFEMYRHRSVILEGDTP